MITTRKATQMFMYIVKKCSYPCNLLERNPLRVIKADFLFDKVSSHQTPVDLQVDGHQKQTL